MKITYIITSLAQGGPGNVVLDLVKVMMSYGHECTVYWPLAGERKNSLFFGSGKMAGVSVAYHTIISTCKMQGVSALQYFKDVFPGDSKWS